MLDQMMDKADHILDITANWFGRQFEYLGKCWTHFVKVKYWKENNRKLFVKLLPISLPLYLATITALISIMLLLSALFIAIWIFPCFIGILIIAFILSLPLLFWEIYTGKQSKILSDLWRK